MEIKDSSSINGATLVCMGNGNYIKIGTGCMFSDEIQIWNSDTHPIYDDAGKLTNPSKPITIGDRVWLGKRVTILKGVTIGSNCIVGMNSTVTKDLQGDTLYVGNPAKAIKKIGFWGKNHITE